MTGLHLAEMNTGFTRIEITGRNAETGDTVSFHLTSMDEARRFALEVLAAIPPVDGTGGRYCVGCRHARRASGDGVTVLCENPVAGARNDPVYGRPIYRAAEGMRAETGSCGEAGKLWEPRVA